MDRNTKEVIPLKRNALDFVNQQISSAYNRVKHRSEHSNLLDSVVDISQKSILILGLSDQEDLPLGSITPIIISDESKQWSMLALVSPTGSQELYENPTVSTKIPTEEQIIEWFTYIQQVYDNIPLQDRLLKPPSTISKAVTVDNATYTAQNGEYKPVSLQIINPSTNKIPKTVNPSLN